MTKSRIACSQCLGTASPFNTYSHFPGAQQPSYFFLTRTQLYMRFIRLCIGKQQRWAEWNPDYSEGVHYTVANRASWLPQSHRSNRQLDKLQILIMGSNCTMRINEIFRLKKTYFFDSDFPCNHQSNHRETQHCIWKLTLASVYCSKKVLNSESIYLSPQSDGIQPPQHSQRGWCSFKSSG